MVGFALTIGAWSALQWERHLVPGRMGELPFAVGTPDRDNRLPIVALSPQSRLAKAGARAGDTIVLDHFGDVRRRPEAGEPIKLTWFTKQNQTHLEEVAAPKAQNSFAVWDTVGSLFFYLGCLTFATVIGFRLASSTAMRALSFTFILNACNIFSYLPAGNVQTFLVQTIYPILLSASYLTFTYFALIYPEDRLSASMSHRRGAFVAFAIALGLLTLALLAQNHAVFPRQWRDIVDPSAAKPYVVMVAVLWSLASLATTWSRAAGAVRQRIAWVSLSVGTIYATYFFFNLNAVFGFPLDLTWVTVLTLPLQVAAIAALGYALLRYQLFDIGFVVNRALVATVISGLLLIVFAVTEWGVDKLLHFEGREKNVIFDAAVALSIILCFHRIQHWVSHRVDHTFFRQWYEAAEAMKGFLSKTSQITDSRALLDKYVLAIKTYCETDLISIYLAQPNGSMVCARTTLAEVPRELDVNDDLLIELRHTRQVVKSRSGSRGEGCQLALPMMTQGRLRGIVLLGDKSKLRTYRPDEIAMLARAAQHLGTDVENLRAIELEQHIHRLSHLESSYLTLESSHRALEREVALLREVAGLKMAAT